MDDNKPYCTKYSRNIPAIKAYCSRQADFGYRPIDVIGEIAVFTYIPIIDVGYILSELFGMTEELKQKIERLEKYYR